MQIRKNNIEATDSIPATLIFNVYSAASETEAISDQSVIDIETGSDFVLPAFITALFDDIVIFLN